MTTETQREIVQTAGEATGKINGFNHIVLVCKDMEASVRFYRDLLGLKVVKTAPARRGYERQYFFELPNGELFSLYQMSTVAPEPQRPVVNKLWPTLDGTPPDRPEKLDHMAFNVDTREEVLWFQRHLREHGVLVSEMIGDEPGTGFLAGRIYFVDPDGTPLEVATSEPGNPGWQGFDYTTWYEDTDPVPSVRP